MALFVHEHKKAPEQSGLYSDVEHRNTIDTVSYITFFFAVLRDAIKSFFISTQCSRIVKSL